MVTRLTAHISTHTCTQAHVSESYGFRYNETGTATATHIFLLCHLNLVVGSLTLHPNLPNLGGIVHSPLPAPPLHSGGGKPCCGTSGAVHVFFERVISDVMMGVGRRDDSNVVRQEIEMLEIKPHSSGRCYIRLNSCMADVTDDHDAAAAEAEQVASGGPCRQECVFNDRDEWRLWRMKVLQHSTGCCTNLFIRAISAI